MPVEAGKAGDEGGERRRRNRSPSRPTTQRKRAQPSPGMPCGPKRNKTKKRGGSWPKLDASEISQCTTASLVAPPPLGSSLNSVVRRRKRGSQYCLCAGPASDALHPKRGSGTPCGLTLWVGLACNAAQPTAQRPAELGGDSLILRRGCKGSRNFFGPGTMGGAAPTHALHRHVRLRSKLAAVAVNRNMQVRFHLVRICA